jgi:hypothetical protein
MFAMFEEKKIKNTLIMGFSPLLKIKERIIPTRPSDQFKIKLAY